MKRIPQFAALIAFAAFLPLGAQAAVYVDENFEGQTVGTVPTNPAQKGTSQVTNVSASGLIGNTIAAQYNDNSSAAGYLEYNVGASPLGAMYISFDLLNNNPGGVGSGTQPIIFSVGTWDNGPSANTLSSNAKRAFSLEFYGQGVTSTLKTRTNSTALDTLTYDMNALQQVQVWANDNDSSTLSYTRPDNLSSATLGANSFVIWINGALVGAETDSGYKMNEATISTVGDATLGRVGFNSSTANLPNFLLDNIYIADAAPVPEPAAAVLLLVGGLLLGWRSRRHKA